MDTTSEGTIRLRLTIVLLLAFLLQAAFGSRMVLFGAYPNISLTVLLVSCLFTGANTGAFLGFLLGLLEASYLNRYVGSVLVSRTLVGWAVGLMEESIFRDNLLIALATALVGTLAAESCFFIFAPQPHVTRWAIRTLATAGYNTALTIPLYLLLHRVLHRDRNRR